MRANNLIVCVECDASKWFQYASDLRAVGWRVRWVRRHFLWWRWWSPRGPLCPDCVVRYPNAPGAPEAAGVCLACRIEADIGTEERPHPVPAKYHTCVPPKAP